MKKLFALLLAICLLAGCFAGCTNTAPPAQNDGGDQQQGGDSQGGVKQPETQEDYSETGSLNILWHAAGGTDGKFECVYKDYQSTVPDLLYDTLIKLDMEDTNQYVARMADKWEISEDGLTYAFHLRDDLNWTDGQPVTADDFVFSFEAQLKGYGIQSERGSFAYIKGAQAFVDGTADSIEGIQAEGKNLTITLDTPYGYMMRTLATFCPYPRHCFPEDVDYAKFGNYEYWEFPIHCGPYKLESVTFPDSCVLVRNDDWYGPKPGIKTVHGLSYDTGGVDAAAAALIAGDLDLVHSNDYNDVNFAENIVAQNPDYQYNAFSAPYFRLCTCNMTGSQDGKWNKFMENADFRKAVNAAIDKSAIASYFPGQGVALSTMINPSDPYYDASVPLFERDVEGAKKLLEASGYDGSTLRVAYYYSDQTTADIVDLICQNLEEIGIKTESTLYTQDLTNAIYEMKNWDILYCGANQLSGIENYNLVSTGAIYDKYLGHEAERDELFTKNIREALVTTDPAKLKEIAVTLQQNNLEHCMAIPVLAMDKIMVYNAAKWSFDPAWLDASDLAIYRTCDLRLESWKLLKP